MNKTFDKRLQANFTMQIIGMTGSGKTYLTRKIIENAPTLINPPVQRIIYAYGEWQEMFEHMEGVEFVRGISDSVVSRENLQGQRTLLILDDVSDEISEKLIGSLFIKMAHHRDISVIFLSNALFSKELRNYRLIATNTMYYIIFRSSRDHGSVTTLAKQMFGTQYKSMLRAYEAAVSPKYGYLFIDLKSDTPPELRLRTNILPDETTICYVIKDG